MTAVSSVWLNGDETHLDCCRTLRDVKALCAATQNKYYSSILTFDIDTSDMLLDDYMSPPAKIRVIVVSDDDIGGCRREAHVQWNNNIIHSHDTWVRRLVAHAAARDPTIWRRAYEQMSEEGREDWRLIVNDALLSYVSSRSWQLETILSFLKAGRQEVGRTRKRARPDSDAMDEILEPVVGDGETPVMLVMAEKCIRALATMRKFVATTTNRFNDIPFNMHDDTMVIFGNAMVSIVHQPT